MPGEFHGWRSLVGYSPWGRKESDTTERLSVYLEQYNFELHGYSYIPILKNKYINQISDQSKKILQFDETWILYNQSPSLTKYIKLLIYFIQIQKILPKNSPIKTYYTIFIPATIRRIIKQLLKK